MCALNYLIQFNGEPEIVPISSPSKNFTIDQEEEKQSLEGLIYTLDFENRTGQDPCHFSIPGEFQLYCFFFYLLVGNSFV